MKNTSGMQQRLGWKFIFAVAALQVLSAASAIRAAATDEQVEADWKRQDEQRLMQIRTPSLVRFAGAEVNWPGVNRDDRKRVPHIGAMQLDGRLTEPAWAGAISVPPATPEEPKLLIGRDDSNLYVGISLPDAAYTRYQGDSTSLDAGGAVDGVKDGKYGFHTWLDKSPWWQVDLGSKQPIQRIVVYNRLDYAPGLHNADSLLISTSDDGQQWTLRHDNHNKFFGGVTSGAPLEVAFGANEVSARYVRLHLQHDAPIFLHLDEVEVYGPEDKAKNLALHKPARQSSLSIWSRGGQRGNELFAIGKQKINFAATAPLQLAIDGKALGSERAVVSQSDGITTAEIVFPVEQFRATAGAEFFPRGDKPLPLDIDRDWQVSWNGAGEWGFGKNSMKIELKAPSALKAPINVRVETVVFALKQPERRVVWEKSFDQPGSASVDFVVEHEGAAAILVECRQGEATWREGEAFFIEPIGEMLERSSRLFGDFGINLPKEWNDLQRRRAALVEKERSQGSDRAERTSLYRESRWLARNAAFKNPLLAFEQLLFVKRFTQQTYPDICLNHMPWCSRPGGDLCVISPLKPDGQVRNVINGQIGPGHIHGMDLWYDGDRIVFAYAKTPTADPPAKWLDRSASYELRRTVEPTHLFEIGVDGSGVRQLTSGEWSDLDPTYLPSGEVAFTSERCEFSLQCNELDKDETSCNIYVTDPSGKNIRQLTINKDGDYLPHTLANGMIGYTRWEYHERLWAQIQSIWVVRPDGTGADAIFKQHFNDPWALEDSKSIPDSNKLVAVAAGHHTLATGPIVVVDPTVGINNSAGINIVTPGVLPPEGGMSGHAVAEGGVPGAGGFYQTPWPLSEKYFLTSYTYGPTQDEKGYGLYLVDVFGTRELIYRDPEISCTHPIPVQPRRKPPVMSSVLDKATTDATCVITDVYEGLEGVQRGTIRYIRIASCVGWPYDNTHGGQRYEADVKQVMVNWNPARVLGIVPVEEDGSAHFRLPSGVAVYFQALDANFMEVRRMRSFINFEPGETRGCTGCHETRAVAPVNIAHTSQLAASRVASVPLPPSWGTGAVSFLRDVQPVLDRQCASCHGGLKPAGDIDLTGGLTAEHNRAWDTIFDKQLVARSNIGDDARITQPYEFGSHKSKLVQCLKDPNHVNAVHLTPDDWMRLVTWVDVNGPYHGGFINKRSGRPLYDLAKDPALNATLVSIHQKRCASCHKAESVSRTDWIDIQQPDRSRFLVAPLGHSEGIIRGCAQATYTSRDDADYQAILNAVQAAAKRTWEEPRRDVAELQNR